MIDRGTVYVVSTPIGNLEDISLRLKATLGKVNLIACEDTRHTKKLLSYLGIHTRLISYHNFNESSQAKKIINFLMEGNDVAIVSDAGCPVISDPGYELIKLCHENKINIVGIPGPSAVTTAISISGMGANGFIFEGFFPKKKIQREAFIANIKKSNKPIIFFESVHRVREAIDFLMLNIHFDHECFMGRELTKKFEEYFMGSLGDLNIHLNKLPGALKGEYIFIIQKTSIDSEEINNDYLELLKFIDFEKLDSQSIKEFSRITGISKNKIYREYIKKNC